ncbi:MCE family protein [Tomitella biformata]|uniref:MCE family protein n=1 Tax=Tomitella biformata TaxID=630403 RepID=UPI000466EEC6|nr:MCE family protein [Tomitella biformata]
MRTFREMNPAPIAFIGLALTALLVVFALQYDKLPFFNHTTTYQAEFSEAGGLEVGNQVDISGMAVGTVQKIALEGDHVLVAFGVRENIVLGEATHAAITTQTALGKRGLTVVPDGAGSLAADDIIPVSRTRSPYSLTDALSGLANTVDETDVGQLDQTLRTLSDTFDSAEPSLHSALDGVSRLSATISSRDDGLRALLAKAEDVTGILAHRSDQMDALLVDADALLAELLSRRADLDALIGNIDALATQLSGLVADNREALTPALRQLDSVLDMLVAREGDLSEAVDSLGPYSRALGESVSMGPFFLAYVQNVLPEANLAPLIDVLVPPGSASPSPPELGAVTGAGGPP